MAEKVWVLYLLVEYIPLSASPLTDFTIIFTEGDCALLKKNKTESIRTFNQANFAAFENQR
jgi:hypothetical protein